MNFTNTQYLPHIIGASLFLLILFSFLNRKYFTWIKTYWFFERSWTSRISAFFYILSLFLMMAALLDLRGPEQKIKTNLPDQKTIIILDSSASMLAEDIRPSRFGKAIQLARHFVKNAAGHQISIVLFSDTQKRLIPFTDDIDLLDSRLAALEKTNVVTGGSNISQAIAEAVGYFDTDGDKSKLAGNVLVFTDAEESEGSFDVDLGNSINLAVVGIGTGQGGNIPLRWEDGSFRGYKTSKGEPVITKLDEEYIKKIGKNVKNYKYWIANSYSLPTEDILNFFRGTYNKTQGKGDLRVRPVFSHLILIPAIILYCIAIIFGRFKSFKNIAAIALLFLFFDSGAFAEEKKKDPPPLTPALKRDMEKMKSGKADRKEILKIAENLLKNNDDERANDLYAEYSRPGDDQEVIFNRATTLLKMKKLDEAMPLVQQIFKNAKNEEIKNKMRHNILLTAESQKNEKNSKKDDKSDDKKDGKEGDQDKKDGKENNKDGKDDQDSKDKKGDKNKDGKEGKDGKDSQKGDNQKQDKQNKNGQGDKDNKDEKDGESKKDPKDLEKPPTEEGPKTLEEKEKKIGLKRKMVKTPAMIKQILSDDRELQKKMMDTSTNQRGASQPKRDW